MHASSISPLLRGWGLVLILLLAIALPPSPAHGQEKDFPQPIAEEDLGGGLRAVWYSEGKPPVIYDDVSGLMLKGSAERPIVVDMKSGSYLSLDDEGRPQIKVSGKGKGGPKADPKAFERMRSFMKRARDLQKARKGKKGPAKGKKADPSLSELELLLQLLGVSGEEKAVLEPRLTAVLGKQDQIRRSVLRVVSVKGKASAKAAKSADLPTGVQRFLSAFRAQLRGEGGVTSEALVAYRAARKAQGAELTKLRSALREVLTATQEATLVAVGVLD